MAQSQAASGTAYNTRRAPVAHSEAVQEAKRREKMQSHGSSHRAVGGPPITDAGSKDAAS